MDTEPYLPASSEQDLDVVLADYLRLVESGEHLDHDQFLARHPQLAQELRDFFANRKCMEQWTQSLQPEPIPPPKSGKVQIFGAYELLEEIAHGGMGIVFKARHINTSRLVALKRMRMELITQADRQRFRIEAENASHLDHPNIVPIYDVGEYEGQPYFTMKLIDGDNLTSVKCDTPASAADQRWTAQLLAKVARGIHHAHQRRIIHRDLKPANILIDALGEPHITDFGLARRVEADTHLTLSGVIVGTPSYMAPEQANCEKVLTTAVDVWSLGAILYERLTGRLPFEGRTAHEIIKQLQDPEREPVPARAIHPRVDRDLEAICMKCLEKDPHRRYGSAEVLAEHLELWLAGKPVPVRLPGLKERLMRWCWNHPIATVLSAAAAVVLIVLTLTAVAGAHDREAKLEREVLHHNQEMAKGVASTVVLQLQHLSTPLVQLSEHKELKMCLENRHQDKLQRLIAEKHKEFNRPDKGYALPGQEPPYVSWYVLDLNGKILAVSPWNERVVSAGLLWNQRSVGPSFIGRDYFEGALRHSKEKGRSAVHVSRLYRAVNDDKFKFALSVPVLDKEGNPIGVLATTIPTSSTIGTFRLSNQRRIAVLVGREDTNPPHSPSTAELPEKHLIFFHPAYRNPGDVALEIANPALQSVRQRPSQEEELKLPGADAISATDDRYSDPVGVKLDPAYEGRWLAGFAPVGNTEFVVIVQQRYDEALSPDQTLARDLILRGGIALAVGVLLVGALIRHGVQRMLKR